MKESFYEKVYQVVEKIPKGRVTSYGAIAKYLSSPKGARMVGWAMNNSHNMEHIPAHRVVNRIGMLSGKLNFGDIYEMQELLEEEGIQVVDDQIQDFNIVFWDPIENLS